jgi:HEAT repeat protein
MLSDSNIELRITAIKRIGMSFNPKYIPDLLNLLKDPDTRIREVTIQSLGAIGEVDSIIDPIIGMLKDPQLSVKLAAIKVLGEIRSIKAIKPLTKLIEDPNSNIRSAIAVSLGQIEDKQALVFLLDLLKDSEINVKINALVALGQIGDTRAIDPIVELLSEPALQTLAIITLQKFKDPRIIKPISELLTSKVPKVRQCAVLTLGTFRDPSIIDSMLKMLNDVDPDVRRAAAAALSEIKDAKTTDLFILSLHDAAVDVRETSAKALGKLKDQKAVQPLIDALNDSAPSVREEAANALGELGNNQAIKALVKLLKDNPESVRIAAIRSIGKIESQTGKQHKFSLASPSIRSLLKLIKDPDKNIRFTVGEAMARIYLTQNKIEKAGEYYEMASKEAFNWDFHKDFFKACAIGCKILENIRKDQYVINQPRFHQINELLKTSAKTGGKVSFISEHYWYTVEALNTLFISADKEQFLKNAQDYSMRILLLNKKLPETYRKIIEGPEEAINQKFQIINKRGLELAPAMLEIQSLKEDIINIGVHLLILEPLDLSADEASDSQNDNTTVLKAVLSAQITPNSSLSSKNMYTNISPIQGLTAQKPNFIIEELEIGKNLVATDKIQIALIQMLNGAKRTSLIEPNRDVITRYIDRYYDYDTYRNQHILKLKKEAIQFAIKSKIIGFLDDALYENANFCIFPELLIPYSYMDKLKEFANRYNLIIVGGMEHAQDGEDYVNRAFICAPNENPIYFKKNCPTILPNSEKYISEWKENINPISPPVIHLITSPFGKFSVLLSQEIVEIGQYLVHISEKYHLDFIIFLSFMWHTERELKQLQKYANDIGKPIIFVNTGQFGGSTVFKPKDTPDYDKLLQENTEKIVMFSLSNKL